jgi:uncharacterized protein (DUF433 family)
MMETLAEFEVERRNEGYYVAGTPISLDSIAWALQRGESADDIFEDFPAVGSRQKLDAVIAFIAAHRPEMEAYLAAGARQWQEARKRNPPELVEKARALRESLTLKRA